MTYTYSQSTGELLQDGAFVGTGYSGTGEGRNNPDMQDVPDTGPLPQGDYVIGDEYNDAHLGPCVMALSPDLLTNTFGRSAFRVHGDNARHDASHGCVILGPAIRHAISDGDDRKLKVIA